MVIITKKRGGWEEGGREKRVKNKKDNVADLEISLA